MWKEKKEGMLMMGTCSLHSSLSKKCVNKKCRNQEHHVFSQFFYEFSQDKLQRQEITLKQFYCIYAECHPTIFQQICKIFLIAFVPNILMHWKRGMIVALHTFFWQNIATFSKTHPPIMAWLFWCIHFSFKAFHLLLRQRPQITRSRYYRSDIWKVLSVICFSIITVIYHIIWTITKF